MNLFGRLTHAVAVRIESARALATARRDSAARLQRGNAVRLLVVCYGNIYRSAFVGRMLRDRLGAPYEVRSCGFHSVADRPSPERHVRLCSRYGVSLERHRSAVITAEDAAWADLIILMDRHNRAALRALGADEDKFIWLGSLIDGPVEIPDPYKLDDRSAERIVGCMHEATEKLIAHLAVPAELQNAAQPVPEQSEILVHRPIRNRER